MSTTVFVNALSADHFSGRHLIFGHLRQMAQWIDAGDSMHVLLPSGITDSDANEIASLANTTVEVGPTTTKNTWKRIAWERFSLPKIISASGADVYFTPTGTVLSWIDLPQVSLAPNPWCMMRAVPKSPVEKIKAAIQRRAYRRAQFDADMMGYCSQHMRYLYRENAGQPKQPSADDRAAISYIALKQETWDVADKMRRPLSKRTDMTIVAVSAMAPWKGPDRLVHALAELHKRGVPAKLRLVGPWPDESFRHAVQAAIDAENVRDSVTITGRVDQDQLHREMASARCFALPSLCESFGIPALEAQVFGTPVVGSNTTAMEEIGGAGGRFAAPTDISAIADHLEVFLTDDDVWETTSDAARSNAALFSWPRCTMPLMGMFRPGENGNLPLPNYNQQTKTAAELLQRIDIA